MAKRKPVDEQLASDWWDKDGRFIDPDESSVPWYDKRHLLAQTAYCEGYNAGLAAKGTQASPKLANTVPLVLYFGNVQDREDFMKAVFEAKPDMISKRWPE